MRLRVVSSVTLMAAAVCFALPWFAAIRGDVEILDFSGQELVTGTRFSPASPAFRLGRIGPQPAAGIALLLIVTAAVGGALRKAATVAGVSATGALVALGLTYRQFLLSLSRAEPASIVIRPKAAYYFALALVAVAAFAGWRRAQLCGVRRSNRVEALGPFSRKR